MKFDRSGKALSYPGNTIICTVPPGSGEHRALVRLQEGLRSSTFADAYAFLPPDSFHMTLYRGVNHLRRLADEWPRDIALDTPLEEVTRLFAARLGGEALPAGFRLRPLRLGANATGESQLVLEGLDQAEREKLRLARTRVKNALNHERPGDTGYAFHITFSYRIRELSEAETTALDRLHERLFGEFASVTPVVRVGAPALCRYDDMTAFHSVLGLAGEAGDH